MTFNGSRLKAMQDRAMLERLAEGTKPRAIAAEFRCSYSTIRRRLSRYVQAIGCATPEQAVAQYTAEKIKRALPSALALQIDMAMGKKR